MTPARELVFPGAVEEAEDLFNREAQVASVCDALRGPARRTVVLFGGRLLGKTSLLNVIAQWAEADASYMVVRLAHARSREDFMAEIVHGIHERVGADRSTTRELFGRDGTFRTTTVARFVTIVRDLAARAPKMRFLLCVDELDSLLQGCDDETARQILDLVLYLTEQARLPIRFLFTMSRIPDRIRLAYGSPFLNQSTIVELLPWPAGQSREFADWLLDGRLPLDGGTHAALFSAAGGHPYFTKAVLKALLDARSVAQAPGQPSAAAVAAAVEAAVRSREVDIALSNIMGVYLPDGAVGVLDRAAANPAGLPAGNPVAATDHTLATLTESGLLAGERGRYVLRLGLWKQWRGVRQTGASRPGRLARFWRAIRWPAGKGLRVTLLCALVVLLAVAFGPALLFPSQDRTVVACDGAARGLRVQVSHPAYISSGDEHELRVGVTNQSQEPIDGSVVVVLTAGGPGEVVVDGDNRLPFDQLEPSALQTLVVPFRHRQPGRLLPQTSPGVAIELRISAEDAECRTERWSLPVAPLPYVQNLQRGAVGLLLLLPAPMLIESIVRRIGTYRGTPADERREGARDDHVRGG
jgi:hypothetical protein